MYQYGSFGAASFAQGRKPATLDLSQKDLAKYSLSRMIKAAANTQKALAPFENEISEFLSARTDTPAHPNSFYVPVDALISRDYVCRDMTVAGVSGSEYLKQNQQLSFSDLLRARSVVTRLGAEWVRNLVGAVSIPRTSADITAYWLTDEGTAITEGQPTVANIALVPKIVGAYTEVSRLLTLQSQDALIFAALAKSVAAAVDKVALRGAGSGGEPQGIIGTGSVGTFTGSSLGWAALVNAQEDVFNGREIDPAYCGYVFTPATATLLMAREKISTSGNMLWTGTHGAGEVAGCQALSTSSLAAATGIFGDFSQLLIGEWNSLQVEVNPFQGFTTGLIGLRCLYACDIAVRDASAFSTTSSIT